MQLTNTYGNSTHDGLQLYLEHAFRHQLATYDNKRGNFLRIDRIDKIFLSVCSAWENPPGFLEAILVYRTHSAFRVAALVAMSGALPESFPLQRFCLELAGYAIRIKEDPTLAEKWLRRDENKKNLEFVRAEFSHGKIRTAIAKHDSRTSAIYHALYEQCITWGAHPNEKAITTGTKMTKINKGKKNRSNIFAC